MPLINKEKTQDVDLTTRRHSLSHILAMAVQKVFPGTRLGIGPAIDTGCYYDFDCPAPITEDRLKLIQEEMCTLLSQGLSFERFELPIQEALQKFQEPARERVRRVSALPSDIDWTDMQRYL